MMNASEPSDTFKKLRRMQKELNKTFEDFWKPTLPSSFKQLSIRTPLVNIQDKESKLLVSAELPGIEKNNIKVNVEEQSISIQARQRKELTEENKKKGYFYRESSAQDFYRKLSLPAEVIAGKAKADYKNGILTVELPKKKAGKEKAGKSKSVKVQ